MIVTALVAVVLGVGRFVVIAFGERLVGATGPGWPIFAFLVAAAVLLSLPPLLAVLLPRYPLWGTLGALVVVGLATALEASLFRWLGFGGLSVHLSEFIELNGMTVAWVLAFALTARHSGYRLGTSRRP
ncbi:MAG TPA: hypothetical protein VMP01_08130 [Pirellulaceae bacterium]|nr:hypothetical protein [Pirellulaceae bacterium]